MSSQTGPSAVIFCQISSKFTKGGSLLPPLHGFLVKVRSAIIEGFYRPQTKFAKVMFLYVSVCPQGRGEPGQVPPSEQVPTRQVHPPEQGHPPWVDTPRTGTPPSRYPPPGRYNLWAGTPPRSSSWWEIRATSGWYASCWNASLLAHLIDRLPILWLFYFFQLFCILWRNLTSQRCNWDPVPNTWQIHA